MIDKHEFYGGKRVRGARRPRPEKLNRQSEQRRRMLARARMFDVVINGNG